MKVALLKKAGGFSFLKKNQKNAMNKYTKLFSLLLGIWLLSACSGHQVKGYEIDGRATLPEFEGKMVYMKDALADQLVDSATIINGKFLFSDTATVASPTVKILIINTGKLGLEYRLPVVIENGTVRACISNSVYTEGTVLNERMQDFLIAIDEYSTTCKDKQVEQIKSGFADLLKKYIEINNDNVVGEYIRTAYRSSL